MLGRVGGAARGVGRMGMGMGRGMYRGGRAMVRHPYMTAGLGAAGFGAYEYERHRSSGRSGLRSRSSGGGMYR